MYLIYFAILLIIPIWAQIRVKRTYKKYSKVSSSSQMRGAEVARRILDENGLYNVNIEEVRGILSDHYDPRSKTVRLSSDNYHGHSVAAAAVAAHEVGLGAYPHHGLEVGEGIVGRPGVEMRHQRVTADVAQQHGIAVGRRLGDVVGGDRAARAGTVLDDKRLAEVVGELGAQPARDVVL